MTTNDLLLELLWLLPCNLKSFEETKTSNLLLSPPGRPHPDPGIFLPKTASRQPRNLPSNPFSAGRPIGSSDDRFIG
jgi:hypothetical protein